MLAALNGAIIDHNGLVAKTETISYEVGFKGKDLRSLVNATERQLNLLTCVHPAPARGMPAMNAI